MLEVVVEIGPKSCNGVTLLKALSLAVVRLRSVAGSEFQLFQLPLEQARWICLWFPVNYHQAENLGNLCALQFSWRAVNSPLENFFPTSQEQRLSLTLISLQSSPLCRKGIKYLVQLELKGSCWSDLCWRKGEESGIPAEDVGSKRKWIDLRVHV